jgi:hypothetical protein
MNMSTAAILLFSNPRSIEVIEAPVELLCSFCESIPFLAVISQELFILVLLYLLDISLSVELADLSEIFEIVDEVGIKRFVYIYHQQAENHRYMMSELRRIVWSCRLTVMIGGRTGSRSVARLCPPIVNDP